MVKTRSLRKFRSAAKSLYRFRGLDLPVIATAAWSIPRPAAAAFPEEGSGLARYASVFNGVEVNSTFYRRHKTSTFERWAGTTPEGFRFAVKLPKEITHQHAMKDVRRSFEIFLHDISALGEKRGPLLCQLPPFLRFDPERFEAAFEAMRVLDQGPIVIEARHKSWASEHAVELLQRYSIDRVLADPVLVWPAYDFQGPPRYIRLHGKPKVYYSRYSDAEIDAFSELLGPDSWCVFDNTASGAAIENALTMLGRR